MKSEESNLWLKKLFNAEYFDTWLAVSYLYRYPSVGIHQYICRKLQYSDDIIVVLPQLVHIFLYHADTEVSMPIYNLFKVWSGKSKKFFCAIYFYLKAYIDSEDSKKSIYCYFLICDMFQMEKKHLLRNTKMLEVQLTQKRRINRTLGITKDKKGVHSFDGIFLFFMKSVVWSLGGKLLKSVNEYEEVFLPTKMATNINFSAELNSGNAFRSESIKSSINLLLTLVEISSRLKKLPKNLRQKGLEMELKLINCNLPGKISLPFSKSKYVLSVRIEYSHVLNSAENTPFIVVFEVADQAITNNVQINEELRNASLIMQQLNTVSGLTYLSDINNIKENVIASLEKILNTERPMKSTTGRLEEQNRKRETISKKINEREKKLFQRNTSSNMELIREDSVDDSTGDYSAVDYSAIFFSPSLEEESQTEVNTVVDIYYDEWKKKEEAARKDSVFAEMKGWKLSSLIVKTGNSLKQEIIAYQILHEMKKIWMDEKKDIWIRTYKIYFINNTAGLVETITNAYSIHKIKEMGQEDNKNFSLKSYFIEKYGYQTVEYKIATLNFLKSLVGYSLASYILQIKDRHNGNILLDSDGHVVHVDFGFILGDHPGFYCVEVAPFKFCKEYFDLLDDLLEEFKMLFLEGFIALRKHSERLCRIIEILSENSDVRCINKRVLYNFRDRLKLEMSDKEIEIYVMWLINKSFNSMGTGLYDSYQYFSNGYL
ncbi:Phosphatidylinositol 4-kinase beta [Nosema granulosis]|uniref:Phosphatidylinositol 4-kinase beta n=1 Tax=Nosema granulosis TaxID=83296 RepID=A0A9P6KZQ6_9MICR|nr:Phosphatidylinositol 4-kinase beta [Nosema granulosis]